MTAASDCANFSPAQRGSKGDLMLPSAVIRLLTPTIDDDTDDRSQPFPT